MLPNVVGPSTSNSLTPVSVTYYAIAHVSELSLPVLFIILGVGCLLCQPGMRLVQQDPNNYPHFSLALGFFLGVTLTIFFFLCLS